MENKNCPECGKAILGRQDKKFCSDLCRHSFNNHHRSTNNGYINSVNSILRKNRSILAELIPADSARVSKFRLSEKGFNFHYFTSIQTTRKGNAYFYCYEYGYLPQDNNYYMLVKKKRD